MESVKNAAASVAGAADAKADGTAETKAAAESTQNPLEAFLADESNKTAYDAAVADAVKSALEEQKAAEAEKARKAKLTAEQRVSEKEQELAGREARLQAAELKSEAVVAFGEAKIPAKLAECLNYSSRETYEQSLAAAKEAFREAVEAAVNDRLRGNGAAVAVANTANTALLAGQAVSGDSDFAKMLHDNQAKR